MSETRMLNVASDLCGRQVRVAGTFETAGVVTDVIVHPTEGRVIGFVLRTLAGALRRLSMSCFSFGEELVASSESLLRSDDGAQMAQGVAARRKLLGAGVVTDDGQLLGRIREVCVSLPAGEVFYTVAPSGFTRLFAEPFQMRGDLPHAYSPAGTRLFVAREAMSDEDNRTGLTSATRRGAPLLAPLLNVREKTAALIARHGLVLWVVVTMLLLGGMIYL